MRDVECERVAASRVLASLFAVHEDGALPVHGSEVQQDAFALEIFGERESAAIHEGGVGHGAQILFLNPRKGGLNAEGNEDLVDEFGGCLLVSQLHGIRAAVVVPKAVEVHPVSAYQLRTGVFLPHVFGVNLLAPRSHQFCRETPPFGTIGHQAHH